MKHFRILLFLLIFIFISLPAYSAGRLTYYCSTDIPWCELMKKEFEKRTGIRVAMTRASSGETLQRFVLRNQIPRGMYGGAELETLICKQQKKDYHSHTFRLS